MAEVPQQPLLTAYGEVSASFEIIRKIRAENLRLHPEIFRQPMYHHTELYRDRSKTGGFQGENEVLMKNVYYLATLLENLSDAVVLTLVNADVLTVDEGKEILQQPTNKLRGVKMFACLVEKEDPDNEIFQALLDVLRECGNEALYDLVMKHIENPNFHRRRLEGNNGDHNPLRINLRRTDLHENLGAAAAVADNEEHPKWACEHCTFLNEPTVNVCGVCDKTKDFNPDDSLEVLICPQCTLMNEPGAEICEACNAVLEEDDENVGNLYHPNPHRLLTREEALIPEQNLLHFD